MDTGATLAELIEGVQLEIGHSTAANVGLNYRDTIAARIRREYRRLHADFDWPHLLDWYTMPSVPGENVYSLPDGVALAQVSAIWAKGVTGKWERLKRNLTVEDYNEVDSDAGDQRDPLLKWRAKGEQIEVWPFPLTDGQIRVVAKSERLPLIDEDAICDLDTDLIEMFAAAALLFKAGADEAGLVLQRARERYETLRQRLQTGTAKVSLG